MHIQQHILSHIITYYHIFRYQVFERADELKLLSNTNDDDFACACEVELAWPQTWQPSHISWSMPFCLAQVLDMAQG